MEYYEGDDKQNKQIRISSTYQTCIQHKIDVTSEISIANEISMFFTNTGQELARKILTTSRTFESFLNKIDTTMPADPIIINEIKEAFFP